MDESLELTEEQFVALEVERAAKMKRMATAVKAVGGWVSYFFGMATLSFGTLNILHIFKYIDPIITGFGVIISLFGIFLLLWHIKEKNLSGKPIVVKLVKYAGGILFVPGLLAIMNTPKNTSIYNYFFTSLIIGFVLIILSSVLKKVWGIKTEKRKKVTIQ